MRETLRAVWGLFLPAILSALAMRFLVPSTGSGLAGVMARLGQDAPLLLGVALFLLFSALAHYWSRYGPLAPAFRRPPAPVRRQPWIEALALPATLAAALAAAFAARVYVRPFRVLSESMLPTLAPGDLIAGLARFPGREAGAATPRRGDVVMFGGLAVSDGFGVGLPEILVKRVVGLPGDRIEMRGHSPLINGWRVPSCDAGEYLYVMPDTTGRALDGHVYVEFLEDRTYLTLHTLGAPFPEAYVVKPGEVFVLGDNRGNSMDSRAYRGGRGAGVPVEAIEARVDRLLFATNASGHADLGRFLRPVDRLRVDWRFEGVQLPSLQEGIARCLATRPVDRWPPPPVSQ
jgi:signal peptidase I